MVVAIFLNCSSSLALLFEIFFIVFELPSNGSSNLMVIDSSKSVNRQGHNYFFKIFLVLIVSPVFDGAGRRACAERA